MLSAVIEGWQLERLGDWYRLEQLDPALADVPVQHPLFVAIQKLRISWRRNGSEAQVRTARELLEPVAISSRSPSELVLRAELSLALNDASAARASLGELQDRAPAQLTPQQRQRIQSLLNQLRSSSAFSL